MLVSTNTPKPEVKTVEPHPVIVTVDPPTVPLAIVTVPELGVLVVAISFIDTIVPAPSFTSGFVFGKLVSFSIGKKPPTSSTRSITLASIAAVVAIKLSDADKIRFMKQGWNESSIPENFNISDKFEIGLFNIDAKGIGKGEVYCCWRFANSSIEGGTKSFDVTVNNVTYEVKDYSGPKADEGKPEKENKKSIRVGVEGTVSKFPVWKTILRTVDMLEKISADKWKLLPGADETSPLHSKWERLLEIIKYINTRVKDDVKIVTGEFNKKDEKHFTEFYLTLNELLSSLGDAEEFNQLVAYGPNQKPLSLVIDPISLQDMAKTGELTIKVQTSGYDAKPTTLINYLKKLPYISSKADPERGPDQFNADLQRAVAEIIRGGDAENWLVFRGTASNMKGTVISQDRADEFRYAAISQGGVKFYEPKDTPKAEEG